MSRLPAVLSSLALAAVLFPCWGEPAYAAGYPRLGLYGGLNGMGYPYILGGNRNGPLDLATCDSVARYDQVILDASPITEYRRDVLTALRARHQGIQLLAYVNAGDIWYANQPDSTVHYPTRFFSLVRRLNGFLYDRKGNYYPMHDINLARRDGAGRYVVAESLAVLFQDAIVRTGIWDGMFLDVFCNRLAWSQTPAESIDFQRAGYPSLATFDAAYEAGGDVLASRLRALSGTSFLLVGNCGQGTKYTLLNGWMRENFPEQNGGNWDENMFRDPGGYFIDEAKFLAPRQNYIFSAAAPYWAPYDANNTRKTRFGLASAALGEGFGVIGYSDRNIGHTNYSGWWYDEYAVDLTTGHSSDRLADTGWLGQPIGGPWQMIWPGTGPDASSNPDFETDVTTGWTFAAGLPAAATLTRDTGTSASGGASARVRVTAAGDFDWRVTMNTAGTIPVSIGLTYTATFWARASSPRALPVILSVGGIAAAGRNVNLTPSWQRFQVMLIPNRQGNGKVSFFLAGATGDVWLDDVHFQAGVSSLWRRDFQNGIVMVNPSSATLTVDLGRTFQRIAGVVDPYINDGLPSSQVTIAPRDARFLIGDDMRPPAPVLDLHPVQH